MNKLNVGKPGKKQRTISYPDIKYQMQTSAQKNTEISTKSADP